MTILSADTRRRTTARRSRRASCAARSRPTRSRRDRAAYAERDIDLRLGSRGDRRRPARAHGRAGRRHTLAYDRLVLASGSLPRALGTPGESSPACTPTARWTTRRPCAGGRSASSALVIGGGFIGMETTASLRRRGLAVTQVDLADRSTPRCRRRRCRASLERLYRERGVDVILGDAVAEFRGSGRQAQRRGHARRQRDRGRARDRRRRRAAVDGLPRGLRRRARARHGRSSTSASRRTSRASGPWATSRTSTTRSSATAG